MDEKFNELDEQNKGYLTKFEVFKMFNEIYYLDNKAEGEGI